MTLVESAARFFRTVPVEENGALKKESIKEDNETTWFEKDRDGDWLATTPAGKIHVHGNGLKGLQNLEGLVKAIQQHEIHTSNDGK